MTMNNLRRLAIVLSALAVMFGPGSGQAYADDFGNVVHHIEARYHVHRQYRLVMGFAGLVVRVWHVGGVKSLKVALFENQRLANSATDGELDEIVQRAGGNGWQPMVRSYSRRTGEHIFIYAKDLGKDVQLLVVNVEPNEAVVVQVKVNPDKFFQMIDGNGGVDIFNTGSRHRKDRHARPEVSPDAYMASASPAGSDGTCVFFPEDQAAIF
jgi:hypothetical protein